MKKKGKSIPKETSEKLVELYVAKFGNWDRITGVSWVKKLQKKLSQLKSHINAQKNKKYSKIVSAGKKKRNEILNNLENDGNDSDEDIKPSYPKIHMEMRTKLLDAFDKHIFRAYTLSSEKVKKIGFKKAVKTLETIENLSKLPRRAKNTRKTHKIERIREYEIKTKRKRRILSILYLLSSRNMFD